MADAPGNEIELAAEVQPAAIKADFDGMRERLGEILGPYDGITAETAEEMPKKDAKKCRASLNAMSRELNAARIAVKKDYDAPLREFEAEVKELDGLIKAPCKVLDRAIKKREKEERDGRKARLEQVYEDFAPALAGVVDFDAIVEKPWLNKSFGEKKAEDALCDKAARIARDWEALKKTDLKCPRQTEAQFFRSLSLQDALEYDEAQSEQQDKVDALRNEVEGRRYGDREEPETVVFVMKPKNMFESGRIIDVLRENDIHGSLLHAPGYEPEKAMERIKEALK